MTETNSEPMCHCGRPLHYQRPETKEMMMELCALLGEIVLVRTENGTVYRVQRHYIALHGLRARDLPRLGFERVTDEKTN